MNIKRFVLIIPMIALLSSLIAGCAKSPEGVVSSGTRLIITMTVAGEINPNYHYYVAFDTTGTSTPGPLPVVAPPWGNGWGTGNITHYVVYDALQPQGGYGVYRIPSGTDLLGSVYVGPPVSVSIPPSGSNKLQFTVDLSQLASTEIPADNIDVININFITTDKIPLDPNTPVQKYYDGLGQTGNNFIQISVNTNQTYSNSTADIEDKGDVPLPDLDITDWSVEVQRR
ncbi:MAG: hypothetical protein ABFD64_00105 [Armatimonadota bacterium]